MKLLALVYSVVTLASLATGTHACDSAHLRGAIEAVNFLTEDNDTCRELNQACWRHPYNGEHNCCPGSNCIYTDFIDDDDVEGGTCTCGLERDLCTRSPSTCCSGFICGGNYRCELPPPPLPCVNEGDRCDRAPCCKGLVCDRLICRRY